MSKKKGIILFLLLVLVTYPMFYFSYKFSDPKLGMQDYFNYYKLYKDWDFAGTAAPFNTRILSSYLVHLFYSWGLGYETEIVNTFGEKQVYFSAIFASYLSILVAAVYFFKTAWNEWKNLGFGLISSFLFLFSFGTIFWSFGAGNDGFGIMFIAVGYYFFRKQSYWIIPVLILSLFQREFVFVVFGALSFFHFWFEKENRKYLLLTLITSMAGMGAYVILRNTLYDTGTHLDQVTVTGFMGAFNHFHIDGPFIKQVLMTQNILFVFTGIVILKKFLKEKVDKKSLFEIVFLMGATFGIVFLGRLDTSGGRFFYMLYPIVIFHLLREIQDSEKLKSFVKNG